MTPTPAQPLRMNLTRLLPKRKKLDVRGREVILYWRGMRAGRKHEFPISLVAAVPGRYWGPASRAYLYDTDEHKQWADPLRVEITPKITLGNGWLHCLA